MSGGFPSARGRTWGVGFSCTRCHESRRRNGVECDDITNLETSKVLFTALTIIAILAIIPTVYMFFRAEVELANMALQLFSASSTFINQNNELTLRIDRNVLCCKCDE